MAGTRVVLLRNALLAPEATYNVWDPTSLPATGSNENTILSRFAKCPWQTQPEFLVSLDHEGGSPTDVTARVFVRSPATLNTANPTDAGFFVLYNATLPTTEITEGSLTNPPKIFALPATVDSSHYSLQLVVAAGSTLTVSVSCQFHRNQS